jgi:hypothetical protein
LNRRHLSIFVLVLVSTMAVILVANPPAGTSPVSVNVDNPNVSPRTPITGTAMTTAEPPVTVRLIVNGEVVQEDITPDPMSDLVNGFSFSTRPSMVGKLIEVVVVDGAGNTARTPVSVNP